MHKKMIYEDEVVCTPGFTPLSAISPPTLHDYVILYQPLPNTIQFGRWGSLSSGLLSNRGSMRTLVPTSFSGSWHWKGLGTPGAKKSSQARAREEVCALPAASADSQQPVRHSRGSPGWLPYCLRDVAPQHSFYPKNHLPQVIDWSLCSSPCVRDERFCSAMLTTCFLVEKLRAVQHRGGSREEQRAVTGELFELGLCLANTQMKPNCSHCPEGVILTSDSGVYFMWIKKKQSTRKLEKDCAWVYVCVWAGVCVCVCLCMKLTRPNRSEYT